jgi:hypothetical protein
MRKRTLVISAIIFILGLLIYWSTAYPSITWWETSEYAAAAAGLGISGPPGSLILTLLGWLLSKLSTHNPAHLFNLFSGVIASLTVTLTFISFRKINSRLSGLSQTEMSLNECIMMAIGSGIIICTSTLWEYAIMFVPYILTALFTILILLSVLNWWKKSDRKDSWKQLFIITLLIGLDFSVHRTNAVLVPGIIIIMLIRNPGIFLNYRSYVAAFTGLILGLSIQLLYIPLSLRDPSMNIGEPGSLEALWSYFSLHQYGGNFLMDILTRKGPLFSYQIPYYIKGFASNFFYFDSKTIIFGFIPLLLGLAGLISLYRRDKKLAISLFSLFLITVIVSIIYFNLPVNYFRSMYRHYLPTFIIFSIFIFYGIHYIGESINRFISKIQWVVNLAFIIVIAGTFLTQYFHNHEKNNGSGNNFTRAHSENIMKSLDYGGIIFSYGDNDYFPEIYLQEAEKVRPDIIQCNLSLLNVDWYIRQNVRHHRDLPFKGENIDISRFDFPGWKTQLVSIPIEENERKKYGIESDTIMMPFPALRENNTNYLQDLVLFDIIKNNRWKKPIYFFKNGLESELYKWLRPYLRDEGLVYKFVPDSLNKINYSAIFGNLGKFDLSGYNDNSISLDEMSLKTGHKYYDIFLMVLQYKAEKKDFTGAMMYLKKMDALLPFGRLKPDKDLIDRTNGLRELVTRELKQTGK